MIILKPKTKFLDQNPKRPVEDDLRGPCHRRFATAIGVLLMTIKVNSVARRLTLCGGKLRRLPLTDMHFERSHRNTWVFQRAGRGRLQTFGDIFVVTGPKSLI